MLKLGLKPQNDPVGDADHSSARLLATEFSTRFLYEPLLPKTLCNVRRFVISTIGTIVVLSRVIVSNTDGLGLYKYSY